MDKELKWNIDIEKIKDKRLSKVKARYDQARSQMMQRTYHHELYGLLAKNKSIHQWSTKKGQSKYFSEGSTQYILRKVLADTIQRMPDGELTTQYDKSTWQHVITQYLFENKVMWSEYEGIDMLSNFTNTFKMSFVYAFAPVRTGFERDVDGDIRISYNLENWADVFVDRDCRDIRRPAVVYHRSYLSKDQVEELLNEDGSVKDSSYCEDTIKYILDHDMFGAKQWESEKLSDKMKNSTALQSIELVTEYRRGASEFVTFVPGLNAPLRKVKNYDPRVCRGISSSWSLIPTSLLESARLSFFCPTSSSTIYSRPAPIRTCSLQWSRLSWCLVGKPIHRPMCSSLVESGTLATIRTR